MDINTQYKNQSDLDFLYQHFENVMPNDRQKVSAEDIQTVTRKLLNIVNPIITNEAEIIEQKGFLADFHNNLLAEQQSFLKVPVVQKELLLIKLNAELELGTYDFAKDSIERLNEVRYTEMKEESWEKRIALSARETQLKSKYSSHTGDISKV